MQIAIKSETDSRIIIYPLIKVLYNYGTVAVYTSNKYFSRLIENDLEGGFRNVRIIINPEADLDAMKASDGYDALKYDFVIYDNVGATDYDMLLCILTNRISESYVQDLLYIIQDEKTNIIKFGSPAPMVKEKSNKKSTKAKDAPAEEEEEKQEASDREFNKWHVEKTDEDVLQEVLNDKKTKWCKFPSFEIIESMESRHIMPVPDDGLIKELYKLFGAYLSIDERMFTKGARVKDESSSDISGTDVR
jgi:hypothetical protein